MKKQGIFEFHQEIMENYKDFVKSFINIDDQEIEKVVIKEFNKGKFWPEPLIQFNPAYKQGGDIDKVVKNLNLHHEISKIFKGFNLYQHQIEAIRMGSQDKPFIVTSGTGSGKSLTYFITIFNHLLNTPNDKNIQAVIVYPMNALINSQIDALDNWKKQYEEQFGEKTFPIKYSRYTGQEDEERREEIKKGIPNIILTNYVMLDLIFTRKDEESLKNSIIKGLKYIVFDELHTYNGRQGSDVSMLIRKIAGNVDKNIVPIGTSATMVSGEGDKKEIVANFGTKIFGKKFQKGNIVEEKLAAVFDDQQISPKMLIDSFQNIDKIDQNSVKQFPLSVWLEQNIAIKIEKREDGKKKGENVKKILRRDPITLSEIVDKIYNYCGIDKEIAEEGVKKYLKKVSDINQNYKKQFLPYKIHQFISQTGSIKISLDKKIIKIKAENEENGVPIYQTLFGKRSGGIYLAVSKDQDNKKLLPRIFNRDQDIDQKLIKGYLIPNDNLDLYPDSEKIANFPQSWFNIKGEPSNRHKDRFPEVIFFNIKGEYSDNRSSEFPLAGYFMSEKLLFDIYDGTPFSRENEYNKLKSLGSEARSTSTTVLTYSILKKYIDDNIDKNKRKLLSFTDNRQDAALQTGHFNDFINIVTVRSILYKTLKKDKIIEFSKIGENLINTLDLPLSQYCYSDKLAPFAKKRVNDIFKNYLTYRVIQDLQYGWRDIFPNLEQTGLIKIDYEGIKENCEYQEMWNGVPLLNNLSIEKREEIVYNILNHIREEFALESNNYFGSGIIRDFETKMRDNLKKPWCFDENELHSPNYIRYETLEYGGRDYKSISKSSKLGKYLIKEGKTCGIDLKKDYKDNIYKILKSLEYGGWLTSLKSEHRNKNGEESYLFRLKLDTILFKIGDEKGVIQQVRDQAVYKNIKVNKFFQNLYKSDIATLDRFNAKEHTAQIDKDERIEIEKDFRKGKHNILFCSPTMELGIDISTLDIVHMRNVPPSPANYVQRGGRAGRSGQAALVFTNASAYSPHDKHYFQNPKEMVSGIVTEPKIDLTNEELIKAHLNSIILSHLSIDEIKKSINNLVDEENPKLPLKDHIVQILKSVKNIKYKIITIFNKMVSNIDLSQQSWFDQNWIDRTILNFPNSFDKVLDRWRNLYINCRKVLKKANDILENPLYTQSSKERKEALKDQKLALTQRDILNNDTKSFSLSPFYPFRYLASEGFLPGYNFTRLPLRVFINKKGKNIKGEFLARSKKVALREYGPQNTIYYNGKKYIVDRIFQNEIDETIEDMVTYCKKSGYFLGKEGGDIDPLTNESLTDGDKRENIVNFIKMPDSIARESKRINSTEEERVSKGYNIEVLFSIEGDKNRVKTGKFLFNDKIDPIELFSIPSATLYYINRGWRSEKSKGFKLNISKGTWENSSNNSNNNSNNHENDENIKVVTPYIKDESDILYIKLPDFISKDTNFEYQTRVTLLYVIKRAIEKLFSIKSDEIGVELTGNNLKPNMFIYENTEGSLGVIRKILEDNQIFKDIINKGYEICHFDDQNYKDKASYSDLLSYYNQRYHNDIDRYLVKDLLNSLKNGKLTLNKIKGDKYDEQYQYLLDNYDKNSSTELKFLQYLYKNRLKLPTHTQKKVEGLYLQPDFYYEDKKTWIFCDGTPHDKAEIIDKDKKQREALFDRGENYLVYHYKEPIDQFIERYKGFFVE